MNVRANNRRTTGAVRAMFNDPVPDPEYSSPSSLISPPHRDPQRRPERAFITPSIMFNPSAADRHPGTHARERRQQQQPAHHKNPR